MKALVIKSNHGNHQGFNRTWKVLADFESEKEAETFLYDYLLERDFVDEDGEPNTAYDSYQFLVITEDDEFLFNGGSYGYANKEMKEFFNWE